MTAEIGQAAIALSVLSALWAIGFLCAGLRLRSAKAVQSGRNAVVATFFLTCISTGALIYGFVTDDFSLRYVVEVSSAAQPLLYKIAALWGAMSGSLLLWLWLLTLAGAIVVWQHRNYTTDNLADYALVPIAVVQLFFIILVTGIPDGVYNPLAKLPGGPSCGRWARHEPASPDTAHGVPSPDALHWVDWDDGAVWICNGRARLWTYRK